MGHGLAGCGCGWAAGGTGTGPEGRAGISRLPPSLVACEVEQVDWHRDVQRLGARDLQLDEQLVLRQQGGGRSVHCQW